MWEVLSLRLNGPVLHSHKNTFRMASSFMKWETIRHAQGQPSFQHIFIEALLCARSCICYYIVEGRWSKWVPFHLKETEKEVNFWMSSPCIHHYVYILQLKCDLECMRLTSKGGDILKQKRFAWHSSVQRELPGRDLRTHCSVESAPNIAD